MNKDLSKAMFYADRKLKLQGNLNCNEEYRDRIIKEMLIATKIGKETLVNTREALNKNV